MASQTRYSITETVVRDAHGTTYSQIDHPGSYIEVIVPEDANQCIHPETKEIFYTFNTGGGAILVQAYGAKPGEPATFELFVREKQLPKQKGGYKFLYCKLVKTDQPANAEAEIVTGTYLADLRQWAHIDQCTLIECPQQKHDGAVVILPAGLELPSVDALIAQTARPKQKWATVHRTRKARAAG